MTISTFTNTISNVYGYTILYSNLLERFQEFDQEL